jgi:putative ABC transport system permease protein
MTFGSLALRGARHYWRTNLAVVAGIACAVAVLSGALVVGQSVRTSLRELAIGRLGRTDVVVGSSGFVRASLAAELSDQSAGLIVADGSVTRETSGARAAGVAVYGVDDRFFAFQGVGRSAPGRTDAFLSPTLAQELGAALNDTVLLRTRKPSDIPAEFLHGRRDDAARTIRLRAAAILGRAEAGEFSLRPAQGGTRAIFVRLDRLQRDLERADEINTILVSGSDLVMLEERIRQRATLADIGVRVRPLPGRGAIAVESRAGLVDDTVGRAAADVARELGWQPEPMLTYLANAIRIGRRQVPYSLVSAIDELEPATPPTIVVNEWTARQLGAKIGDTATLEYYLWDPSGRLVERSAAFRVAGIVPINAADRDFAPDYPGITESKSLSEWDPPFPLDLSRIRPADEQYWDAYRGTPKAFVALETGQALWRSRFGQLTSIRFELGPHPQRPPRPRLRQGSGEASPKLEERRRVAGARRADSDIDPTSEQMVRFELALRRKLDPLTAGLSAVAVRQDTLAASEGATDFGEYFSYFSLFLVISALLLGLLFFRLGVEQRLREIGTLRSFGFTIAQIRRLFLLEGVALAVAGAVIGAAGGLAYAWLILLGLRTWWVGAVGTSDLRLHASALPLAIGAAAGIVLAAGVIWWTLRALGPASPRSLLSGDVSAAFASRSVTRPARRMMTAAGLALAAGLAAGGGALGLMSDAAAFFLAGALLLAAAVTAAGARLASAKPAAIEQPGTAGIARLGLRYATWRPGRSVLALALIAAAVFLIVSVEAFRKHQSGGVHDRRSGTGGFALVAESTVPLFHDPSTVEGRDALNLQPDQSGAALPHTIYRLRLRPGDDASCLNLYRPPQRPRVVGVPRTLLDENRFTFASSLAETDYERANPWRLLDRREPSGAIPAIVDATSLQYVLHASLGDEITFDAPQTATAGSSRGTTFRIVGTLADSLLQGELLVSEARFVEAFPEGDGYRFFLIDVGGDSKAAEGVSAFLESRLADFGFDAVSAPERLAAYHRVENTYISTFQALGGLGLLVGTVGLAAIAVRNVLERRRELALLRAIGYAPRDVRLMILAETGLLLVLGLVAGVVCAAVAIAPALYERGGAARAWSLAALLIVVAASGLLSSAIAARAAAKGSLVEALRSE